MELPFEHGTESEMKSRKALPMVLLACALGCGDRSALDVLGAAPLVTGGGPVEGPSSSGGASSGGGSSGSSEANGSGSGSSSTGSSSGGTLSRGSSASSSGASGACSSNGSDSGSQPPSCQPGGAGMTNCGACSESCCTSLEVTGGTFQRTYTNSVGGPTNEADPATVSGFRLDKYLVTVGRFRQFVVAWNGGTGWTPAGGSGKHAHLNGGKGLANSAGTGTYETGWLTANASNMAPTDDNLACDPGFLQTWTASAGD